MHRTIYQHPLGLLCFILVLVAVLPLTESLAAQDAVDLGCSFRPAFISNNLTEDSPQVPAFGISRDVPLHYSIFEGRSCLRDLPPMAEVTDSAFERMSKTQLAAAFLARGMHDAAHEVVLGVRSDNVEEAEYAATHPGQTNWSVNNPLSDEDDILHALIHLQEGSVVGEGNHTGYENAKYWFAGGPKLRHDSADSVHCPDLNRKIVNIVRSHAPLCYKRGVVNRLPNAKTHLIIAGMGRNRTVFIPTNCWDPIRFSELVQESASLNENTRNELHRLQQKLIEMLINNGAVDVSK